MKKYLVTAAGALFLMTSAAYAQSTTTDSTTTTSPSMMAPAPGASSSTETQSSSDAYGNSTLIISVPPLNPGNAPCQYAYAFRIAGGELGPGT